MNKAGVALLCGMLAACTGGTPDSHYYTLSPAGPAAAPASGKPQFRLTSVHLPSIYDRPQMVVRSGAQSVEFSEFDRWAEPLERMTARILAQDIALRRPRPGGPVPADQPKLQISVDEFAADRSGTARLSGTWKITGTDNETRVGDFSYSKPAESGRPESAAAAMSALLGQLADEIDRN
jgi:uncharacterized lipoprotein YmbA